MGLNGLSHDPQVLLAVLECLNDVVGAEAKDLQCLVEAESPRAAGKM